MNRLFAVKIDILSTFPRDNLSLDRFSARQPSNRPPFHSEKPCQAVRFAGINVGTGALNSLYVANDINMLAVQFESFTRNRTGRAAGRPQGRPTPRIFRAESLDEGDLPLSKKRAFSRPGTQIFC